MSRERSGGVYGRVSSWSLVALRRVSGNSGFGIIEVLFAAVVMAFLILAIAPTLETTTQSSGNSANEVAAAGILRQLISSDQQQLQGESVLQAAFTVNTPPFPFPYLTGLSTQCFATATATAGGLYGTYAATGLNAVLCAPGAPATETSYCTSNSGGVACTAAAPAGFYFTAKTSASWVCETGQDANDGNPIPLFQVVVSVTWPSQGSTLTPKASFSVAPPPDGGMVQALVPSSGETDYVPASIGGNPLDPLVYSATSLTQTNTGNAPLCP